MAKITGEGVRPENIDYGIQNAEHAQNFLENVQKRFERVRGLAGGLYKNVRDLEKLVFQFERSLKKDENYASGTEFHQDLKRIKDSFKAVLSRLEEVESKVVKTLPAVVDKEKEKIADEVATDEWLDLTGKVKAVVAGSEKTVGPHETAIIPAVKDTTSSADVGPTDTQQIDLEVLKKAEFERGVEVATELADLEALYKYYRLKERSKNVSSKRLGGIKKQLKSLEAIFSEKLKSKTDKQKNLKSAKEKLLSINGEVIKSEKEKGLPVFEPTVMVKPVAEEESKLKPAEFKNDKIVLPDGKVFDLKRTGFRVGADTTTSTAGRYGITKVGANQLGVADFSLKVYRDAKTDQYGVELSYKVPGEKKWEDVSDIKGINPKELKAQLESSMAGIESLSEQLASAAEEAVLPEAEIVEEELVTGPEALPVDAQIAAEAAGAKELADTTRDERAEKVQPAAEIENIKNIADVDFDAEEDRIHFKGGADWVDLRVGGFGVKTDSADYDNAKYISSVYSIGDSGRSNYRITIYQVTLGGGKLEYKFEGTDYDREPGSGFETKSELVWTADKGGAQEFVKAFKNEFQKLKDIVVAKKEAMEKEEAGKKNVADEIFAPDAEEIKALTKEEAKEKRKQVEKFIKSIGAKKRILVFSNGFESGEKLGLENFKLQIAKLWEILKQSDFKGGVYLRAGYGEHGINSGNIALNLESADWESKIQELIKIWYTREKISKEASGFFSDLVIHNDEDSFTPEKEQETLDRIKVLKKMKLHKAVSKDNKFGKIFLTGGPSTSRYDDRQKPHSLYLNIEGDWLGDLAKLTNLPIEQIRAMAEKAGLKAEETAPNAAGGDGKKEGEPVTAGFTKEKFVAPDGAVVNMEIAGVNCKFSAFDEDTLVYEYFIGDDRVSVAVDFNKTNKTYGLSISNKNGYFDDETVFTAYSNEELAIRLGYLVKSTKEYFVKKGLLSESDQENIEPLDNVDQTAANTVDTQDKKKTSWGERWEQVKGIKEAVWQKEIGLALGGVAYKTASTVFGVKFLTDLGGLAHYGWDTLYKKKSEDVLAKGNYGDIAANLQGGKEIKNILKQTEELIGKMAELAKVAKTGRSLIDAVSLANPELSGTDVKKAEIDGAKAELVNKINNAKNINPEGKKRLLGRVEEIVTKYEAEIKTAEDEAAKKMQQEIAAYLTKKISAISIARDALVTATTFSGMLATRAVIYAGGAMIERARKALNEVKQNKAEGAEYSRLDKLNAILKDVTVNATIETARGLALQGAKKDADITKTKRVIDFVQSVGVVMRGFGIYGTAASEGSGMGEQLDKFLENLKENGLLKTMGENFSNNVDRVLSMPGNLWSKVFGKGEVPPADLATSKGRVGYIKSAMDRMAQEKNNTSDPEKLKEIDREIALGKELIAKERSGLDVRKLGYFANEKADPEAPQGSGNLVEKTDGSTTSNPDVVRGGSAVEQTGDAPADGAGVNPETLREVVGDSSVQAEADALKAQGINVSDTTIKEVLERSIQIGEEEGVVESDVVKDPEAFQKIVKSQFLVRPEIVQEVNLNYVNSFLEKHPGANAEVTMLAEKYGLPKDSGTVQKIYDSAKVFAGKDVQTGKVIDTIIEADARRKLTILEAILNSGANGKANALSYLTDKAGLNLHGVALETVGGSKGLAELVNNYKSSDPEMVQKLYLALEQQSGTTLANSGIDFAHQDLYAKGENAHFLGLDEKGKPIMEEGEAYKVAKEIKSPDVLGGRVPVPKGEEIVIEKGVLLPLDTTPTGSAAVVPDTFGGHGEKEFNAYSAWAETDPGAHILLDQKGWSEEETGEFLQTFAKAHPDADLSRIGSDPDLSNQFLGSLAIYEPKGSDVSAAVDREIARVAQSGDGTRIAGTENDDWVNKAVDKEVARVVASEKPVEPKPTAVPVEATPEVVGPTPKAPIVVGELIKGKVEVKFLDDTTVRDVNIKNAYEPKIDPNDATKLKLKIGNSLVSGKLTHVEISGITKPAFEYTNDDGSTTKLGFDKYGGLKAIED